MKSIFETQTPGRDNMDLFMKSLEHLLPTKPEPLQESSKPEKKDPTGLIFLGQGKTFTDSREAYAYLLSQPVKEVPAGYRNTLSKSLLNSSEDGQINSLYKDWKAYRQGILGKIKLYFKYAREEKKCLRYVEFLVKNLYPHNIETFIEGKVDLTFFKFWVVFNFYIEHRGNK